MLQLPIDQSTKFIAGSKPAPMVDFETKKERIDSEGRALFRTQLIAGSEERSELLLVRTAGEPKGIVVHESVKVTGPRLQVWSRNGETAVSFDAERIEPERPKAA